MSHRSSQHRKSHFLSKVVGLASLGFAAVGVQAAPGVEYFVVDSSLNYYSGYASDYIKIDQPNGISDGIGLFGTGKKTEILADGVLFKNGLRTGTLYNAGKSQFNGEHDHMALLVKADANFANGMATTGHITDQAYVGGTFSGLPAKNSAAWYNLFNNSIQGYVNSYPAPTAKVLELEDYQLPGYNPPPGYAPPANLPNVDMSFSNSIFVKNNQFDCRSAMTVQGFNPDDYCNGDTLRATDRAGNPNYFGDIVGMNQAHVLIGEGVYYFRDFRGNQPYLVAAQPHKKRTVIYLQKGFNPTQTGKVFVGPASAFDFGANKGKIEVCDTVETSTCSFGGTVMLVSQGPLVFPRDSPIWATVSVPRNSARLSQQFQLFGQVFADTLLGDQGWEFTKGKYIPFNPIDPVVKIAAMNSFSIREATESACQSRLGTACRDTSITVNIDHESPYPVSLDYDIEAYPGGVVANPATEGADFVKVASEHVTIPVRQLSATVRLTIIDDVVYEGAERFRIVLRNLQGASFAGSDGKPDTTLKQLLTDVTILDNDPPPVVFFDKTTASVQEGNQVALLARMTFRIGSALTVPYSVVTSAAFGATEGADYVLTPSPKNLVFAAYSDTASILVSAVADGLWEPTERFAVELGVPSIADVTVDPALAHDTVSILSGDPMPDLRINDTTVAEGGRATLRVWLGGVGRSGDSACFDWTTQAVAAPDSATTGLDYTKKSGHACITAGSTGLTLPFVQVLNDTIFEKTERFQVRLTPTYGATAPVAGTVSITNTNPAPTLIVENVTQRRPTSGSVVYRFKVRLVDRVTAKPTISGADAVFSWSTQRSTALPGTDYDSTGAGSVRFRALTDSVMYLQVTVLGSVQFHADPLQFRVVTTDIDGLDFSAAATAKKPEGVGTILTAVGAPRLKWIADTVQEMGQGQSSYIHMKLALVDSLDAPTTSRDPVVAVWSTQDSTATVALGHYVAVVKNVLTIPAGSSSIVDSVRVIGNDLYQPSPRFLKGLIDHADSRASGYDKARSQTRALGGILDGDVAPVILGVDAPQATEGNAGTKAFSFVLKLDKPSGLPFTYSWATTGTGTATAGTDYLAVGATTRTIAAGSTADTVLVQVVGDQRLEPDETFGVSFTPVSGSNSSAVVNATGTILNDDARPRVSLSVDSSVVEGNAGTHPLTFKVRLLDSATGVALSAASSPDMPVSIWWRTQGGTALVSDNDYNGQSGRWDTLAAGTVERTFSVQVRGDTRFERGESFLLVIDSLRNIAVSGNILRDTGWILNDDALPRVTVRDTSVQEPSVYAAVAQMAFVVNLDTPSGLPVRLEWQTLAHSARGTDSFALAKGDYRNFDSGSVVVFAPGETSKTLLIPVYGDTTYERTEDFYLQLGLATDATIDRDRATGTIFDGDQPPGIRIDDGGTVVEGARSVFTVRLDRPSEIPVRVRVVTRDGTAKAGADYRGLDTNLVFLANEGSKSIQVPTYLDTVANERTEAYRAVLLSIQDAAALDTTADAWIVDQNPKPVLVIDSIAPVDESDTTIRFWVRLSQVSALPVQVGFATVAGTATDNQDFKDTSGILTIPAMTSGVPLPARILADLLDEDSLETFQMRIHGVVDPSLADIQDSIGLAGILDNDPPPSISVNDTSVLEPAAQGAATGATFTVRLDAPSGRTVTVAWRTVDSTAKFAEKDYASANGTLTFAPGQTSKTVSVNVLGDTLDEYTEYFKVVLSNPSNALLGDPVGIGGITDNDTAPALKINDPVVREGHLIDVRANFVATLERPSGKDVTIHWATRDSTAKSTGALGSDTYDFVSGSGDVTIPAGARSVAIPVTVKADNFGEPTESFSLILSPVANVELGRSDTVGVATLLDDNGLPALYIDSVAPVVEADSTITFHLRLQFPRSDTIHVKIRTAAGTATPGEDYVDSSVTIAIPPTKTSYDLNIRILDDRFNEPDTESFTVKLVEADSANIQDSTGLASLLDDDLPPTVSVLDGSVVEPAAWGAVDSLRMKVVLSAISHVPASVEWRTQDGSAKGNLDYFPSQGTLLFSSGDSVLLVSIPWWATAWTNRTRRWMSASPRRWTRASPIPSGWAPSRTTTPLRESTSTGRGPPNPPPAPHRPPCGSVWTAPPERPFRSSGPPATAAPRRVPTTTRPAAASPCPSVRWIPWCGCPSGPTPSPAKGTRPTR